MHCPPFIFACRVYQPTDNQHKLGDARVYCPPSAFSFIIYQQETHISWGLGMCIIPCLFIITPTANLHKLEDGNVNVHGLSRCLKMLQDAPKVPLKSAFGPQDASRCSPWYATHGMRKEYLWASRCGSQDASRCAPQYT